MSPLTASNVDSQGITYSLNANNRTATIIDIPDKRGMLAKYEGTTFAIVCRANTGYAIDTHGVGAEGYGGLRGSYSIGIWEYYSSYRQKFTIDSAGRIVNTTYSNWCIYCNDYVTGAIITMKNYNTLSSSDLHQYWNYDGTQIRPFGNNSVCIDVYCISFQNGNYIQICPDDINDAKRFNINVISGSIRDDIQYTIRRGVMDTNGVIYKVNSVSSIINQHASGHKLYFPYHRSSEISNSTSISCSFGK